MNDSITLDSPDEQITFLESSRKKLKNDVAAECVILTSIGAAHLKKGNYSTVKVNAS